MSLLEVRNLSVAFGRRPPTLTGIDFTIDAGARVGLIGQSGSGKSVTALAVMGLLPEYATATGSIRLGGTELIGRPDALFAPMRGNDLSMVFQEPMTALDPTMKVGRQVAEVVRLHRKSSREQARALTLDMLEQVDLPDPEQVYDAFAHQLSGGQRQRVVLAMALINQPDLVICDEPTTALDVTVQQQVLRVLRHNLDAVGAACLFITHDLAVLSQVCDQVLVMLDGAIVEAGELKSVFTDPQHPYTRGLLATARLDQVAPGSRLPTVADFYRRPERTPGTEVAG
ncbi:ABC transporter ATP-binding protein [Granulicoccus phenolivorans]|uniref:ABC transporter ATP-binding protein n=1 Tax=Granulicoccus phenolivorans TaxID=266854 RepID=UPI00042714F5|nr:ABC transporter ATP-binding protein [Granulicoccus phenolivorans]